MAVNWNTSAVEERMRRAVMRGIIRGTEAVRSEAISLIQNSPKTGRVYKRRGVEHQASAPGEPFASDTGRAVNSLETHYDFSELSGVVVSTDAKFPHLEYGTQHMEPRPSLRPALANKGPDIERFISDEIAREFR